MCKQVKRILKDITNVVISYGVVALKCRLCSKKEMKGTVKSYGSTDTNVIFCSICGQF